MRVGVVDAAGAAGSVRVGVVPPQATRARVAKAERAAPPVRAGVKKTVRRMRVPSCGALGRAV